MPRIRLITDLRNTNEISELCHAKKEQTFDSMLEDRELDAAIAEAEAGYTTDKQLIDAREALLIEPGTAAKLVDSLEKAIFSLESMPKRGALRKTCFKRPMLTSCCKFQRHLKTPIEDKGVPMDNDSKSCTPKRCQGFESLPLRHEPVCGQYPQQALYFLFRHTFVS